MNRKIIFANFIFLFFISFSVSAQDTVAHDAHIHALMKAMHIRENAEKGFMPVVDSTFSPEYYAEHIQPKYDLFIKKYYNTCVEAYKAAYAREEIIELTHFINSPLGQKMIQMDPIIYQRVIDSVSGPNLAFMQYFTEHTRLYQQQQREALFNREGGGCTQHIQGYFYSQRFELKGQLHCFKGNQLISYEGNSKSVFRIAWDSPSRISATMVVAWSRKVSPKEQALTRINILNCAESSFEYICQTESYSGEAPTITATDSMQRISREEFLRRKKRMRSEARQYE